MDDDRDIYAAACPEASAGLPLTDFEKKCLRELSSYQILDTEPEAAFDDITEVAAVCCGCPVGIVSCAPWPAALPALSPPQWPTGRSRARALSA